jgi:hypothetical protein
LILPWKVSGRRKGRIRRANVFIILRYILSLSRAESMYKKESKHEFYFVK